MNSKRSAESFDSLSDFMSKDSSSAKKISAEHIPERSILVGLRCEGLRGFDSSDDDTMEELEELLRTAGGCAVMRFVQRRSSPDPGSFIGDGKAAEIADAVKDNEIDLVVFDNEITPSQNRVLEERLGCRVIDRTALILDIFAQRANTSEGKLQVALAQYQYILPRLSGMWGHLTRQNASGGKSPIGTRGPGETQLETDRRHIRRKIQKLQEQIDEVKLVRSTQRKRRVANHIPLACIVGYTNVGKSTLLNSLTGANIHANDRLFDTLDPTTRVLDLGDGRRILLSDTVGFIRNLPHDLIDAFRATLEELTYADVLIHVIDASDPLWQERAEVVEDLISQLGVSGTPEILVFNKADKIHESVMPRQTGAVYCSALRREGLDELREKIISVLNMQSQKVTLLLPYSDGAVLDFLYRHATVLRTDYMESGVEVEAVCAGKILGSVQKYFSQEKSLENEANVV